MSIHSSVSERIHIRRLLEDDPALIAAEFAKIGWHKPQTQYETYYEAQQAGECHVFVAFVDEQFAGYVTLFWEAGYEPFRHAMIPEIRDLNVLPYFRRRGIGRTLIQCCEETAAERTATIGIGVGMYPDYGNAQRLYVKMGYVPDGRGLTYNGQILKPMQRTINDDSLVLFFTKKLR